VYQTVVTHMLLLTHISFVSLMLS